jgi:hypothetical protein
MVHSYFVCGSTKSPAGSSAHQRLETRSGRSGWPARQDLQRTVEAVLGGAGFPNFPQPAAVPLTACVSRNKAAARRRNMPDKPSEQVIKLVSARSVTSRPAKFRTSGSTQFQHSEICGQDGGPRHSGGKLSAFLNPVFRLCSGTTRATARAMTESPRLGAAGGTHASCRRPKGALDRATNPLRRSSDESLTLGSGSVRRPFQVVARLGLTGAGRATNRPFYGPFLIDTGVRLGPASGRFDPPKLDHVRWSGAEPPCPASAAADRTPAPFRSLRKMIHSTSLPATGSEMVAWTRVALSAPPLRSLSMALFPWISFELWTCSGSRRRERESSADTGGQPLIVRCSPLCPLYHAPRAPIARTYPIYGGIFAFVGLAGASIARETRVKLLKELASRFPCCFA